MQKYRRNIIILVILSLLVFYLALKDDFNSVIRQVCTTEILFLLIALALLFINWLARASMMYLMIRKFNKDYKYWQAVKLIMITNLFHAITPFGTGGEPVQVYFISKDGVDVPTATTVVLKKIIIFQLTLLMYGLASITANYFFHIFDKVVLLRNLVIVGFVSNTFLLLFTFLLSSNKNMNQKISKFIMKAVFFRKSEEEKQIKKEKWDNYLNDFHNSAVALRGSKLEFLKLLGISIFEVGVHYLIPLFLVRAVVGYFPMGILTTIVATNYVILSTGFIPIPGASGGREYTFVAFFGAFISGASLTATMLLWRFLTYYFAIFAGATTLALSNRQEKKGD
jgi:uncharacterized protein (TIRG00374 family)